MIREPPGIPVADYLDQLIIRTNLKPALLLSIVFYIDRLSSICPTFSVSTLTVHRFLISTVVVASKGLSDDYLTNKAYARIGGVSTRELAILELHFLEKMDWRIVPQADVLRDYYKCLVGRAEGFEIEHLKDHTFKMQET